MEKNTKMFDGYADKYDQWFLTNNRVFESELKLLHACLNPLKKDKILSVGCGSGLFESALKREYDIIVEYGLEPSTDMSKIAEKRGVKVEIGDAETTLLKAEEYDVIYLNGCSTYIADLSSAYRNCYNALKKGGSLILLDVPVESAYGILYSFAKYVEGYDEKLFSRITPALPYPIELVKSGIFHSPIEKLSIVKDELKMKNIRFMQTLVAHPIYTNDSVEEPIEGYDKGGYVALIAEK